MKRPAWLAPVLCVAVSLPAHAQAVPAGPGPGPTAQGLAAANLPPLPGVQAPNDSTVPPAHVIGWIRAGQTREGLLEDGDYRMEDASWCDIWYLEVTAGQRVVIELRSRAFDAYLQLLDPLGAKVAEDTDGAGGSDSRITYTAPRAGVFQIVVNNEGDDVKTGPYRLTVR